MKSEREAQCVCGKLRLSSELKGDSFFIYRGEGSKYAVEDCRCGFSKIAHQPSTTCKCENFVTRGPMEFGLMDKPITDPGAEMKERAQAFANEKYPDGDFAQYGDSIKELIKDLAAFAAKEVAAKEDKLLAIYDRTVLEYQKEVKALLATIGELRPKAYTTIETILRSHLEGKSESK